MMVAFADFVEYTNTQIIHKLALLLALCCLGVGFGVGFSVGNANAKDKADAQYQTTLSVYTQIQMDLQERVTAINSLAGTIGSFAQSHAVTPANMSLPAAQRMATYDVAAFERICSQVMLEGVSSLTLAPGGVGSQVYPASGAESVGTDFFLHPAYSYVFSVLFERGNTAVTGPSELTDGTDYVLAAWFPIYVSSARTEDAFWGVSVAFTRVGVLLQTMKVAELAEANDLLYTLWYTQEALVAGTTVVDAETRVVSANTADTEESFVVMRHGMSMKLPVGVAGRDAYFAMYPKGGYLSSTVDGPLIAIIVVVVVVGTALAVACLYLVAYLGFCYRHRHAPREGDLMFIAAITLRNAQPVVEHSPVEAAKMFTGTAIYARREARRRGLYPICDIGGRSVYVGGKDAKTVMDYARHVTTEVSVVPGGPVTIGAHAVVVSHKRQTTVSIANTTTTATRRRGGGDDVHSSYRSVSASAAADHETVTSTSSFFSSVVCRPSVSLNSIYSAVPVYDARRDCYFYGNAVQIAKLCAAVDRTLVGECGWTTHFEDAAAVLCRRVLEEPAATSHIVSEGNRVLLTTVKWKGPSASMGSINTTSDDEGEEGDNELTSKSTAMKHTGGGDGRDDAEDRDSDEPSVAMALLGDAYVNRMAAMVAGKAGNAKLGRLAASTLAGDQQHNNNNKRGGDAPNAQQQQQEAHHSHGGSNDDKAAGDRFTTVTRTATLLHIHVPPYTYRTASVHGTSKFFEEVRRIVASEKGTLLSSHGGVIVCAFNLLTPGGHHQLRAADVVTKLRDAVRTQPDANGVSYPSPFVCSIHTGRVPALLGGSMVVCNGDVVHLGMALLEKAKRMAAAVALEQQQLGGAALFDDTVYQYTRGLCLVFNEGELTTKYDCEAVDVYTPPPPPPPFASDTIPVEAQCGGDDGQFLSETGALPMAPTAAARAEGPAVVAGSVFSGPTPTPSAPGLTRANTTLPLSSSPAVVAASPPPRVVYRLVDRRSHMATNAAAAVMNSNSTNGNALLGQPAGALPTGLGLQQPAICAEEWMYQVGRDEDKSPYGAMNALFRGLAAMGRAGGGATALSDGLTVGTALEAVRAALAYGDHTAAMNPPPSVQWARATLKKVLLRGGQ